MTEQGRSPARLIDNPSVAALLSEFAAFELDRNGICTAWENLSPEHRGAPNTKITGKSLNDFFRPEDQERGVYWRDLEVAARDGRCDTSGWRVAPNGDVVWTRTALVAKHDGNGTLTGYYGVIFDATRQREADKALHASEEVHRALVAGLKDHIVCVLDIDGNLRRWNEDAPQILGRDVQQMHDLHFAGLFTPEDRAKGEPARVLAAARENGLHTGESWRMRPDGTRFRVDVSVAALRNDEGAVTGYGVVIRDITSRFETEQKLEIAREELAQSEKLRSLGELTGGIAHDFNNLLTVVRGSAELLRIPNLDEPKRQRHVEAIIETADRAAELTSQLLSFARRQPLQPELIDLNETIANMAELLNRTLGGGIRVLSMPAPALGPVKADPTQLKNLILNAAINARDAMHRSGTLTIATRNTVAANGSPEVCLSISDTGEGMAPDVVARAFEPFFTTKGVGKGTGLGLSQAYGFAEQSGGKLELASELGRGTTLTLRLPRADADAKPRETIEDAGGVAPGTRILLVEDSRTVAIFAQTLLEDMGCEIVHAKDAQEAMIALDEEPEPFDIIFSDIVMPGLSGLDFAAKVRAQKPTLPILLATGYSEAAARGEGSEFPILPKPYKRETLSEMLGETMSRFAQAA